MITDPRDADAVTVAVSTAGVFRTLDGGASWTPSNHGVKAVFLPDQHPEFGQCVHKIAQDPVDRDRLYLQNHWGVYRSDDAGVTWTDIGDGLPSDFGFAVAAHPRRGDTAYLFPITADIDRVPADHRCRVFRTTDAGGSWEALSRGLPEEDHYGTVLRDALTVDDTDPAGVYFGNRNGELYASADDGDSWRPVSYTHRQAKGRAGKGPEREGRRPWASRVIAWLHDLFMTSLNRAGPRHLSPLPDRSPRWATSCGRRSPRDAPISRPDTMCCAPSSNPSTGCGC